MNFKSMNPFYRLFTILELLIVIAIISILSCLLMPSLSKSEKITKKIVCLSNLKQIAVMLESYSADSDNYMMWCTTMPYGSMNYSAAWDNNLNRYWAGYLVYLGYGNAGKRVVYASNGAVAKESSALELNLICPLGNGKIIKNTDGSYTPRVPGDYMMNILLKGLYYPTKISRISLPSALVVLAERDAETVHTYQNFENFRWCFRLYGEQPLSQSTKRCSPFLHLDGANYLFTDGHAQWKEWRSVTNNMFEVKKSPVENLWQ